VNVNGSATYLPPLVVSLLLAAASSPAEDKQAAITLYKQAVELAKEEKYEVAIALFEEALEKGAPPLTHYNIGKCHESLGDLEQAVASYRRYLDSPDATDVEEVQETIAALEATPSEVTFTTEPEGARVSKLHPDGTEQELGETPLSVTAEAGSHVYVVSLAGHESKKVSVEAGLGKHRDVELELEPVEQRPPELDGGIRPGGPGPFLELGGGVALHLYEDLVSANGDVSLGGGWRFSEGLGAGFALGVRVDLRPYALDAVDTAGDRLTRPGLFATVLVVPAYQLRLHERLAVELSLPMGLAFLDSIGDLPSGSEVTLLGGRMSGGALTLFDLGVGAALRIAVVEGLYVSVEPVRLQLLFPVTKWLSDRKILADMDFTVRLGWQF
jgi:hypothetical protein